MTVVEYHPEEFRMNITGHAEFAVPGEDIVCAGLSMLMATLVAATTEEPEYQTSVYINHDTAEVDIQSDPHVGYEDTCLAVYNTIYLGYRTAEESYPDHVKVTGG